MADALKIGIAGLGTVGASLVRIIQERSEQLAVTCGRTIEITAVTARDRNRDRGIDMNRNRAPGRGSVTPGTAYGFQMHCRIFGSWGIDSEGRAAMASIGFLLAVGLPGWPLAATLS